MLNLQLQPACSSYTINTRLYFSPAIILAKIAKLAGDEAKLWRAVSIHWTELLDSPNCYKNTSFWAGQKLNCTYSLSYFAKLLPSLFYTLFPRVPKGLRSHAYLISFSCGSNQVTSNKPWAFMSCVPQFPMQATYIRWESTFTKLSIENACPLSSWKRICKNEAKLSSSSLAFVEA